MLLSAMHLLMQRGYCCMQRTTNHGDSPHELHIMCMPHISFGGKLGLLLGYYLSPTVNANLSVQSLYTYGDIFQDLLTNPICKQCFLSTHNTARPTAIPPSDPHFPKHIELQSRWQEGC